MKLLSEDIDTTGHLFGECRKCGAVVEVSTETIIQEKSISAATAERFSGTSKGQKTGGGVDLTIRYIPCPKCGAGLRLDPLSATKPEIKRIHKAFYIAEKAVDHNVGRIADLVAAQIDIKKLADLVAAQIEANNTDPVEGVK